MCTAVVFIDLLIAKIVHRPTAECCQYERILKVGRNLHGDILRLRNLSAYFYEPPGIGMAL